MKLFFVFLSLVISAFLSWYIIPRILLVTYKKKLFDIPDERKVHTQAIPRLGGLSFAPSLLMTVTFIVGLRYLTGNDIMFLQTVAAEFAFLGCGLTILYLLGVRDDLLGVRYSEKFIFQVIAAGLITGSGLWINNLYGLFGIHQLSAWIGIPLTILLIVFITNAINLIDGIDGLASGLSIVALGVLGTLFVSIHLWLYATLAFATLGILLPFFYFNVFGKVEKRQKIFMGDTGSLTLGYIIAFLVIHYASIKPEMTPYSEGNFVVAFSTLLVPMFDVVRVICVRIKNGKGLFTADRNHIHHKFLEMGLSPRKAMICIILIACLFSVTNILLVPYVDINMLFAGDALAWLGVHLGISHLIDKRTKLKLVS